MWRTFGKSIAVFILLTLLSWLLAIWTAAAGQAPGWTPWVAGIFTFLLLLLVQLWWFASSKHTPGAGDNLASTAAGELARVGVQATTLIGMPWGNDERSSVYHTPGDVLDTVSPDAVADAIRLGLALARDLDGELANSAE